MKLKNFTKNHFYGLILGIATIVIFVPIIMKAYEIFSVPQSWFQYRVKSKVISLASIANLGWFHYFIKKKRMGFATGILLATFVSFFVIVYLKVIVS
jgi:hypothetical protein